MKSYFKLLFQRAVVVSLCLLIQVGVLVFGVHYRMLAAGPGDPAAWLEAYRALYREQLPRGVYETFVKIPWNRPD